jgi:hypothetical protein
MFSVSNTVFQNVKNSTLSKFYVMKEIIVFASVRDQSNFKPQNLSVHKVLTKSRQKRPKNMQVCCV